MNPRGRVNRFMMTGHGHGHPKERAGMPLPAAGITICFSIELFPVLEGEPLSMWLEILGPQRVG